MSEATLVQAPKIRRDRDAAELDELAAQLATKPQREREAYADKVRDKAARKSKG